MKKINHGDTATKTRSQLGFGLIEVLISIGLVSVLMLALIQVMDQQRKMTKTAQVNSEVLDVQRLFQITISDPQTCFWTFGGTAPTDESIGSIRVTDDLTKDPFATVGQKFGNTSLFIREMTLMSPASAKAANLITADTYYCRETQGECNVWFRVKLEKQGAVFGGKDIYFYNFFRGKFADTRMLSECKYQEAVDSCNSLANQQNASSSILEKEDNQLIKINRIDCPGDQGVLVTCSIFGGEVPLIKCLN